jgi:hypothetical protein
MERKQALAAARASMPTVDSAGSARPALPIEALALALMRKRKSSAVAVRPSRALVREASRVRSAEALEALEGWKSLRLPLLREERHRAAAGASRGQGAASRAEGLPTACSSAACSTRAAGKRLLLLPRAAAEPLPPPPSPPLLSFQ